MINWQVGSNRHSLEWSMVYFGKEIFQEITMINSQNSCEGVYHIVHNLKKMSSFSDIFHFD